MSLALKSEEARRRLARIYLAAIFVCVPFAINVELARPTVGQEFFLEAASLLGVLVYGVARLSGLIPTPPRDPSRVWIVLYGAALAAAAAVSEERSYTAVRSILPLSGIVLYVIVFAYPWNRRDVARLVFFLAAASLASAAYGVIESRGIEILPYVEEQREGKLKILSVFGNPNFAASYLGPVFLLILGWPFWAPRTGRPSWRAAVGAGVGMLGGCLGAAWRFHTIGLVLLGLVLALGAAAWAMGRLMLLTGLILALFFAVAGTRGVWLALACTGAVGVAAIGRTSKWTARAWANRAAAAGLGLVLFAAACALTPLGAYLKQRASQPIDNRLYGFAIAAIMAQQRPWLGWGYGNYETQFFDQAVKFQERKSSEVYNLYLIDAAGVPPGKVHNDLLEIAVDCGLAGVWAFLGILVSFGFRAARAIRNAPGRRDRALLFTIVLALGCVLIDGLFGFPLRVPCSAVLFWGLLGIGSRLASAGWVPRAG